MAPILFGAAAAGGSLLQSFGEINAASGQIDAAKQNIDSIRQTTAIDKSREAREGRVRAGQTRAQLGAFGLSGGSATDILADQAAQQAEREALIRFGGASKVAEQKSRINAIRQKRSASILGAPFKALGAGLNVAGMF